jgi:alginate O-acetyltransferase complex protein AlgI
MAALRMQFHSLTFLAFFVVVYAAYVLSFRLSGTRRIQNVLLLVASYVFYGAWDARFLVLIWVSTALDFLVGILLARTEAPSRRRGLLLASVVGNLGILGFFKYWGFFVESAEALLQLAGFDFRPHTLHVVLPVGISFYTFQSMSYTIDVYRGRMDPTRDTIDFAVYVAFFPQLVAGPIERARHLLPQFANERHIRHEDLQTGLLWLAIGYFLKVCLADTMAPLVDAVFSAPERADGVATLAAALGFSVQIYCDFAGYSLIARGLARLMGIHLMQNFAAPYLAPDPRLFWRRWHISLSTWLRDYLYVPLGGNRHGRLRTYRNLLLTMLLGGLWHGAAWNFVVWGAYHGGLLAASRWREETFGPARMHAALRAACMFALTALGFVVFRVNELGDLRLLASNVARGLEWSLAAPAYVVPVATCSVLAFGFQALQARLGGDPEAAGLAWPARGLLYAFTLACVLAAGFRPTPFVYFQF